MTQLKFGLKIGIKALFKVQKFDAKDNILFDSGWFHNKILNIGLNRLHYSHLYASAVNPEHMAIAKICNIGTGTSTPAASQTGLLDYFASSGIDKTISDDVYNSPLRRSTEFYYQFDVGTFSGENIAELGLSSGINSDYFNRQLTRITSEVTDEELAVGDGVTTNFTGSLSNSSCDPDTLMITTYDDTDTLMTLQDDGEGNLTGDGSGTIIYDTGAYDITFNSAPKDTISIYADYEWQEPTVITVQSDEGLRIYAQIIQYAEGEIDEALTGESFTFENLTDGTSQTIDYTKYVRNFIGLDDDMFNQFVESIYNYNRRADINGSVRYDGVSQTFTPIASGGPTLEWEFTWNPGTFTGDITSIKLFKETPPRDSYQCPMWYEFVLDTPITGIVDTEEIKFTFEITWGEV
jgi:hypothetical protein